MSVRWAINGHWVVERFALFGGKLVVLDSANTAVRQLGLQGQKWPLTVGDRDYHVVRQRDRDFARDTLKIYSAAGVLIPTGGELLKPLAAPPGSLCPGHPTVEATHSCPRCGRFLCDACRGSDGIRCEACFALQLDVFVREQSALFWAIPSLPFLYLFGALGFAAGALAAAAAVGYARRAPKGRSAATVALCAYLIAFGICILVRRLLIGG